MIGMSPASPFGERGGELKPHQFDIKKVHDGWIICVKGRGEHGHFNYRSGCDSLVKLICKGKVPKDPYFREAARRILTETEYSKLSSRWKPEYINRSMKGVR